MFSSIDNRIINHFQWAIRQLELYTPITRKDVINFNLSSIKYLAFTLLLLATIEFFIYPIFSFLLVVVIYCSFELYFELKKINEKIIKIEGTLPQEIITRKHLRIILLFLEQFYLCIILVTLIFLPKEFWVLVLMSLIASFQLSFEYLLCTTSLPPGEKIKREVEKELRSFVLQSISVR